MKREERACVLAQVRGAREADVASRVREAIEDLRERGDPVTFYAVAERAQVARSTLYRRADLKRIVSDARAEARPAGAPRGRLAPDPYEMPVVYWVFGCDDAALACAGLQGSGGASSASPCSRIEKSD